MMFGGCAGSDPFFVILALRLRLRAVRFQRWLDLFVSNSPGLHALPLETRLDAVAREFDVETSGFSTHHSKRLARDIAAWLTRRLTVATLRELAPIFGFGLRHPDSVRGLLNRADAALGDSAERQCRVDRLKHKLKENKS